MLYTKALVPIVPVFVVAGVKLPIVMIDEPRILVAAAALPIVKPVCVLVPNAIVEALSIIGAFIFVNVVIVPSDV